MAEKTLAERYLNYECLLHDYGATQREECLRAAFRLLDLDGDGSVSKDEQLTFVRIMTDEENAQSYISELFKAGDTNRDGSFDEDEYVKLVGPIIANERYYFSHRRPRVNVLLDNFLVSRNCILLEMAFLLLDSDRDGYLSLSELHTSSLMGAIPELEIEGIMALGDKNLDGVLSISEFVEVVEKLLNKRGAAT